MFELTVALSDRPVEDPDGREELASEPHLQLLLAPREPASDPLEMRGAAEHPQRHLVGRIELVQMPTQPLLIAAALLDEVVAVIDQQLDLSIDAFIGPRPAQLRLADGGAGDRKRVDRVRLTTRLPGAPLRDGQLRRHPDDILADSE